jgi:superfamily II DNA or RNA helicase
VRAHVVRKGYILGLTGILQANSHEKKVRLVATYCPILIDYTTNEAVLTGLLNSYHLVVYHLALRTVHD